MHFRQYVQLQKLIPEKKRKDKKRKKNREGFVYSFSPPIKKDKIDCRKSCGNFPPASTSGLAFFTFDLYAGMLVFVQPFIHSV